MCGSKFASLRFGLPLRCCSWPSERVVTFRIAPGESIDPLRVGWTAGNMQTFAIAPALTLVGGEEYLLFEGDDYPFRYPFRYPLAASGS